MVIPNENSLVLHGTHEAMPPFKYLENGGGGNSRKLYIYIHIVCDREAPEALGPYQNEGHGNAPLLPCHTWLHSAKTIAGNAHIL